MVKNVIIVSDFANINGGAAKVAVSSAIGLASRGLNVVFVSATLPICNELYDSGVSVVCLDQYSILEDPNRIRAVTQGVWNRKAYKVLGELIENYAREETVVHIHGWIKSLSVSVIAVAIKKNVKVYITLHDFFLYCPNGGLYNYKQNEICDKRPMSIGCLMCNCDSRSYLQKLWRVARQFIQDKSIASNLGKICFVTISELSERLLVKYMGNDVRYVRVNNMVEVVPSIDYSTDRDAYIFMARLSPEKGLDLFCEVITELGLKGIVCGDGYLLEEYRAKYKNILFTGWVSDQQKKEFLSRSKCCIFPSKWYETFGLTVAEMVSIGMPCIVARQNAAAELIIEGQNGLLFEIGNKESLSTTIKMFESDQQSFSVPNVKNAIDVARYSMNNHVKRLEHMYNSL
ncbi:MAG: glycosyltransferase family 4 protein [Bacteroidales bacterium]|nr:glycosyltransferase family 4 protein [Bacteroidales bacterium]